MMFTRLPWWRLHQPASSDHYQRAACYWPLVGWITGGVMAGVFAISVNFLSLPIAALVTIVSRILLTGALHEDGLADFCDGMGGGTSRERTLEIMKDSHIGTYGVIGLIVYLATFYFGLREMTMGFLNLSMHPEVTCKNPILMTCLALVTMDVWSKCLASEIIRLLPYARKEEEAKNHVVYTMPKWNSYVVVLASALVILGLWLSTGAAIKELGIVFLVPAVVMGLIAGWLKRAIGGYTGDCCGATFLICEASMLLTWLVVLNM